MECIDYNQIWRTVFSALVCFSVLEFFFVFLVKLIIGK